MVPFGLVGVAFRKVRDRTVEAVALAEVGGDLYAVAGAGVRPCQRPAAQAGIDDQLVGRHAPDVGRALHILELAPVEVAPFRAAKPAEEDVARGLHQPLSGHDAVSVVFVGVCRNVALKHRGSRLLDLEEQGVVLVATFEQYYVGPGAHAADANDLPRRVHEVVPLEQVATIFLQGALVALQDGVDLGPDLVPFGDTNKERRIVDYHAAPIDDPGELGEGLQAVAPARLPHGLAQFLRGLLLGPGIGEHPADFLLANARVPDLELSHIRELGHPLPVGCHGRLRGLATIRRVEAVVAASDHEARSEAFDVPLPRPRQGLVGVVDVEEQGALRGGIRPEVREVGVAAKLSLDASPRGAREVAGHHDGRPTHEGERGSHHARVPNRDEVRSPVTVLCLKEIGRIWTNGRWHPLPVCAPGDHSTREAPALAPLLVTRGRRGVIGRLFGRLRREFRVLLDFHGYSFTTLESYATGTASASLAVLGWVEVAPVGFQLRFDLLQDSALLQGQLTHPYVAQPTQEQVG